ncbi:hypothetical protein rpr22_0862 [Rickettsia prowazekii str. Rp22]|uniref:Uncharacterized protein n=1 Tax=Rickettsia prowazekii (strain Rp22) TaxID=449216 RepID=D5AY83_RICPP|nr:hypothetical protein rpr22_0862 [Rickettsia prowazekii str. Rp22]
MIKDNKTCASYEVVEIQVKRIDR